MRILCFIHTGGVFKRGLILDMFNKSSSSPLIHDVINIPNIGFSIKKSLFIIFR
jgi:hypothetical protein